VQKLIVRTDASVEIGIGHFMRCLSFAQHWRKSGGEVVFLMAKDVPFLTARLDSEKIGFLKLDTPAGTLNDSKKTVQAAKNLCASWILVDGYQFDSTFQKNIKDSSLNLLVIDDLGSFDHCYADIVLNYQLYANESLYVNKENYTTLLLGSSYVLLRDEFSRWQGWKRQIPRIAKNMLVTLGGSDEHNVTEIVLKAVQELGIKNLSLKVIVPNNSNYNQLESIVKSPKLDVQLKRDVICMSDLMAWADIAVSAGGTSTWELVFMGLPMITTIIADNQRQVVEELSKAGVAMNLGWYQNLNTSRISTAIDGLLNDYEKRAFMSRRSQSLVDGCGAERVLTEMKRVHQ
jgi:UDP-2,4-diacetamido-2,4,6-trideoxy-beta-L-altropyranose hydrolase